MKKYAFIFIVGVILLGSCKNQEEPLTPSEGVEMPYRIPQGNNEYDQRIVEWNNRIGSFILYKFTDRDAYWRKFNWDKAIFDAKGYKTGGITLAQEAKPEYVEKLLTLVENNYLKLLPDKYLKKYAPIRLLLCDSIKYYYEQTPSLVNYYVGTDYILFGNGGDSFDSRWTPAAEKTMRNGLTSLIFNSMLSGQDTQIPKEFTSLSKYNVAVTYTNMFEKGFLTSNSTANVTPEWDWKEYVKDISQNPYTTFTTPPPSPDKYPYLQGMLLPVKDKNGLVKKKYDIVVKYYKDVHGIDLQAMGDMPY